MTVSTTQSAATYLANGAVTEWPFPFPITDPAWLELRVKDPTGVVSLIAANEYQVVGIADPSGYVIYPTAGNPLPAGYRVRVQRVLPIIQPTDIVNQETFYPETIEAGADYRTYVEQQLNQRMTDIENADIWY